MCAGIVLLLLATQWNWFVMPFERDEGEYAYAAWILENGGVPYRDAFMQKPPMVIYTYWVAQMVFGTACWPPRVIAFLFFALTLGVTAWAARREYGPRCGWITAWLFIPMMALPALSPVAANTEKFMNLPLMGVVALHLFGRGNPRPWVWLAAGASAACAILYKPICLPLLGFAFAVWAVETVRRRGGWRQALLFAGCVAAGAGTMAILATLFFIRRGAVGALWESAVTFNRAYMALSGWHPEAFLAQARGFAAWWWPVILATGWFVGSRPKRAWYWMGLLVIAGLVAYKDANGHYYVMLVPFWAVIGGAALGDIYRRIGARGPRWRVLQLAVVTAAVLVLLIPVFPKLFLSPRRLCVSLYGNNPFLESAEVAKVVTGLTDPDDRVYVAGSEPQILFHAKRRSVTRFVISYPLMLPTAYAKGYQQEVLQSLTFMPPEVIVFVIHPFSWLANPVTGPSFFPQFEQLLKTRYTEVGSYIWEKDGEKGRWVSPYRADLPGNEYLVVFRKKR